MNVLVMCALSLMSSDGYHVVEIPAVLLSDKQEAWVIDISKYLDAHPEFKEANKSVQTINNNSCMYLGDK